ncbi:hypothetical protein [Thalassospira povalilytica]|uniref:Phage abortive infection protein n=1 Tax=Thalassospira povalilytica TaxID=732237 RepID=A0A8I1M9M4_9PROT|nr:hypothetical protein [Thalassospira povalilytica]MBN8197945.1 hypothetical protein [Thalassospira povalilytica]
MTNSKKSADLNERNDNISVRPRVTLTIIVCVVLLVTGFWGGAWFVGWNPGLLLGDKTTQPLADAFSSVNALFAGLAFGGVIYTVYVQIIELKATRAELAETAKANLQMAQAANETVIFNMFQTYCSDYFQKVKDYSMTVMTASLSSRAYHQYLVSRLTPLNQKDFPDGCWKTITQNNKGFVRYHASEEDFNKCEQEQRYKLDELLNFFMMLSCQEKASEVVASCDFSYSWWRPFLWLITFEYEKQFPEADSLCGHLTRIDFRKMVTALDGFYNLTTFSSEQELKAFLSNEEVIKKFSLDPDHLR